MSGSLVPSGEPPETAASSAVVSAFLPSSRVPDVMVGSADVVLHVAARGARVAITLMTPAYRLAVRPLPSRLQPAELLRGAALRGAARRRSVQEQASRSLDELLPLVVENVLGRIALTELILGHVDLDEVVAAVDLDAPVARVDVEAVTNRVDLDALAGRLDVEKVLDRVDLTAVVLGRVDLDALVAAILERIDLVTLAQEVIDAVDLPALVRDSTGTMASDSVRGARTHAIAADEMVTRTVDRLRQRMRREHPADAGTPTPSSPS